MVFDMGQNLAGFPQITVRGKRGQQVRLIVGESLTPDGHVSQKQTGRPYILTYTLKGSRQGETWHPHFTYYGYQYIEIEGAVMAGDKNPHNMPEVDSLASCFISNSAPTTGSFSCSSERWNGTWRIIDNAVRSNWTQVWTDCPHREKLGWLEQDWLNFEGLNYTYDARTMVRQTMRLIADAQHPDGSLPEIAPEYIKFEGDMGSALSGESGVGWCPRGIARALCPDVSGLIAHQAISARDETLCGLSAYKRQPLYTEYGTGRLV